ncbi:hypothetical protein A3C37_05395 [Candidatus Peribacteria bacterium RIFCSPHIGHO2_02_FULL_53_20]|nr:MAG: hypothetical protein A3C37_05395 [Candidatus Peribacteria bacterium RIFCSPHIGHO2_02_FULL_53_20]OGJ66931.1 MAG: hypothetical protein A3B61_05060 [Candidatus Peribacteria bacterium RIFCSPLOWO2_01_FULL_53_10]OGJ69475.1 MAG: hypothetical protein A3G69_00445 [Candidatus Peribacteria bacterium RIFCSPLOWO2_12_FULL_53_10]
MFDKCHTAEYHAFMEYERTVTTRELLRNFRSIKQQLLSGKLHVVRIAVDDHKELELIHSRPEKNIGNFLRAVEALPHPIHIRRTHIFDELLKPRKLRPRKR